MAGAELNDDMLSIKEETTVVLTPKGGTLQTYASREAPYVIYRKGIYYFFWSVDDTGSPNYHVVYGTAQSPLGPIEVAKEPIVLIQNPKEEIYGPAHNSILQVPGKDKWYIVYHRINKNHLNDGPGWHREVCIDRMEFNPDGTIKNREMKLFGEEEYVVNIGPQHPATHGVMRFRVSLEGEIIRKIDANCGYIHRGIEKMNESLTYPQTLALTDRLDYLGAHQNRHALCMCIEKAMGIEVSDRVKYIRTIMDELQRIDSHLLFYSALAMDLGALTAFFYGFRDREKILDIFEETCGGRLIMNYNTIGGVQADLHPNFVKRVKEFIPYMRGIIHEYHDIFTGNIIAQSRMKGVGVLSREDAISFGCTGGTGRASGWACDVRKRIPYGVYDKVDFQEIVYTEGDCFARYLVRMDEIMESLKIIEQLIDNIPEGPYQEKMKPIIRVPEGSYYAAVEGSRGEFGVFLESQGDKMPYRLHYRATGLPLVAAIDTICRGAKIADLIAIGGTLDYVVPDIDR